MALKKKISLEENFKKLIEMELVLDFVKKLVKALRI